MTRTSIHVGPGLEPFAAVRYDEALRPIPFYDFDHRGGEDGTRRAMQRIETPGGGDSGYGLGWAINGDDRGFRRVSQTGGMPGVATVLNLFPDEDLAVVVMTNNSDRFVTRIAEEIAASRASSPRC